MPNPPDNQLDSRYAPSYPAQCAGDALAAKGVDELTTAAIAGAVARDAAQAGVAEIAEGAELMGEGAATVAVGEVLEERAS